MIYWLIIYSFISFLSAVISALKDDEGLYTRLFLLLLTWAVTLPPLIWAIFKLWILE